MFGEDDKFSFKPNDKCETVWVDVNFLIKKNISFLKIRLCSYCKFFFILYKIVKKIYRKFIANTISLQKTEINQIVSDSENKQTNNKKTDLN